MARYRRQSRIRAPLEAVWAFHSRVEGLTAVTPAWMRLQVESVRGPAGETDVDVLVVGTEVRLSVRPFGAGPRTRWTSRIVEREERAGVAWFRDEMVDGPFPRWVHTHRFVDAGSETIATDLVTYDLPFVPEPLSRIGWPGFEVVFADRQRRTRRLLEAETA